MPTSPEASGLVGWVLRRQRLHWQAAEHASSQDFLDALAALGLVADASRLSRWELGRLAVRPAVLAGYEQVTGVAPMALQTFANRVRRSQAPHLAPLPVESTFAQGGLSLDLILEHGEFDSADVARAVCVLLRANDYVARMVADRVAEVLVDRMIVSLGPSYLITGEAIARAVTHPRLRTAVLQRVEHHLADPATGALAGLPELLAEQGVLPAPWLRRQLHSDSVTRRTAGAWAAARLVERSTSRVQSQLLTGEATRALDGTLSRAEWAARMPACADERGRAERERVGLELQERFGESAEASGGHGLTLGRVVARMVSARGLEQSHVNGLAFMVAGGDERAGSAFLDLALDPRRPARVRSRAARALLYAPSPTLTARLDSALAGDPSAGLEPGLRWQLGLARGHVSDRPVRLDDVRGMLASEQLAPAALYSLGMSGSPDLAAVASSTEYSSQVRAHARWWLGRGPAIVD